MNCVVFKMVGIDILKDNHVISILEAFASLPEHKALLKAITNLTSQIGLYQFVLDPG